MKSIPIIFILTMITALPLVSENGPKEINLVFVIDFDDFMCFSCLESFVNFCHSLPEQFRKDHCMGVLTVPSVRKDRAVLTKIMQKKLRGFREANLIDFPVAVDAPLFFSGREKQESCILVIEGGEQTLEIFPFPLSGKTADTILKRIH